MGGKEFFDEVNAPPYLRGEGAKIQHAWLHGFVQNVEPLRPWLTIRMPSFTLTNEQATIITEYFAGLSKDESDVLERSRKPVVEYVAQEQKKPSVKLASGGGDEQDEAPPPGADWFEQRLLRDHARLLGEYAVRSRLIGRFALDESQPKEAVAQGYQDVLDRTGFIEHLYDVDYPFVEAPRPLVAEDRFKLGEELLYELQCLKCHVLGDPSVSGSNPAPSAPNLNLTFRRLRQGWVQEWLKNPAWIQPGTKMPQLFPNMQSAFADYGDTRAGLEAKYGEAGEEQIELLLDFLYNAGIKNYTAVQPGGMAPPVKAAAEELFDEDGGGEEELFEED